MSFVDEVTDTCGYTKHKDTELPMVRMGDLGIPDLKLFDDIDPCDVKQGACGDCWLVSAISALAEFPGQIESLFVTNEFSAEGKYTIRLFDLPSQEWKEITIDDRIAMYREGSNRVKGILPPKDGGAWPLLLEKAWVVHAGGWDNITGGKSCLAFKCMTGCDSIFGIRNVTKKDPGAEPTYKMLEYNWPAFSSNTFFCEKSAWGERYCAFPGGQDKIGIDELFDLLCEWDSQDFLISAATRSGSDEDATDGIVDGHAYSVLSVKKDVCGKGFDLMCLRNPHGIGGKEWKGAWSDDDALWDEHADIAAELVHTSAADSIFWMAKEDAFKYYFGFFVCMQKMEKADGRKKSKPQEDGLSIDKVVGTYENSRTKTKVAISEDDGQVTVANPGYERTYSLDEFFQGGVLNYYGLQGVVDCADGEQVIHWSNGVAWTKLE
mmetsp:Transcript_156771/g.503095  ORF Transcript_156771/g.503095 Transcript_156771/m.503095 type:complete len:435 (-) Transcript_156771:338-1642(-)